MGHLENRLRRTVGVFCPCPLTVIGVVLITAFVVGCGYRYYATPIRPAPEADQTAGMKVSDDGTVTFTKERLEIAVRPLSDEELNRQFSAYSTGGTASTNPYTYGDWKDPETGTAPNRFTVFLLKVSNYAYPKVRIDPLKATLVAENGRQYHTMSPLEFDEYYRPYATANAGNEYAQHEDRKDIFRTTRYQGGVIFSGQDAQGFLLFPQLHSDVQRLRLRLEDVALRFDFRGEPVETADLEYVFQREVGRFYPGRENRK